MKRSLLRQIAGFVISGGLAFAVDACLYALLQGLWGTFWAKQAGFVAGTVASFFLNRLLAFGGTPSAPRVGVFIAYYAAMAWVNPSINEGFLALWGSKPAAFVLTVAVTAVLNFLIMKFIVFKGVRT